MMTAVLCGTVTAGRAAGDRRHRAGIHAGRTERGRGKGEIPLPDREAEAAAACRRKDPPVGGIEDETFYIGREDFHAGTHHFSIVVVVLLVASLAQAAHAEDWQKRGQEDHAPGEEL